MIFLNVSASSGVSGDNSHSNECVLRSTPLNTNVAYGLIATPCPAPIPFAISGAIAPKPARAKNIAVSPATAAASAIVSVAATASASSVVLENIDLNLAPTSPIPLKSDKESIPPAANDPNIPNSSAPTLIFKLSCSVLGKGSTILSAFINLA